MDKFLDEIEAKFHLLAKSPEIGTSRPDLMENLRSFPIKKYVIFYRPIKNGVEIVRVLHGGRDIARLFLT
jgi:toxin ParE1/3/4